MIKVLGDIWNASLVKVYQVKDLTQDSFFGTIWGYLITMIHGDNGVLSTQAKMTVDPLLKTITWFAGLAMIIYRIKAIHAKNKKLKAEERKIEAEAESQRIDNQIKLNKERREQEEHNKFFDTITSVHKLIEDGEKDKAEKLMEDLTYKTNMDHDIRMKLQNRK